MLAVPRSRLCLPSGKAATAGCMGTASAAVLAAAAGVSAAPVTRRQMLAHWLAPCLGFGHDLHQADAANVHMCLLVDVRQLRLVSLPWGSRASPLLYAPPCGLMRKTSHLSSMQPHARSLQDSSPLLA